MNPITRPTHGAHIRHNEAPRCRHASAVPSLHPAHLRPQDSPERRSTSPGVERLALWGTSRADQPSRPPSVDEPSTLCENRESSIFPLRNGGSSRWGCRPDYEREDLAQSGFPRGDTSSDETGPGFSRALPLKRYGATRDDAYRLLVQLRTQTSCAAAPVAIEPIARLSWMRSMSSSAPVPSMTGAAFNDVTDRTRRETERRT